MMSDQDQHKSSSANKTDGLSGKDSNPLSDLNNQVEAERESRRRAVRMLLTGGGMLAGGSAMTSPEWAGPIVHTIISSAHAQSSHEFTVQATTTLNVTTLPGATTLSVTTGSNTTTLNVTSAPRSTTTPARSTTTLAWSTTTSAPSTTTVATTTTNVNTTVNPTSTSVTTTQQP